MSAWGDAELSKIHSIIKFERIRGFSIWHKIWPMIHEVVYVK